MPITDPGRRARLAASFSQDTTLEQAHEYDAVRPRYPRQIVQHILRAGTEPGPAPAGRPQIVELGAGTGILTRALLSTGADVTAVEPSLPMTQVMAERWAAESTGDSVRQRPAQWGRLSICRRTAEQTGLPEGQADLVAVAQAWHWFDGQAVQQEIRRLLRSGGTLAVVGNYLDTSYEWVHRLTRITRAGDVHRPGWQPGLDGGLFGPVSTWEHRWERLITPEEIRRLARTLSSWLSAGEAGRERMRRNLDWYLDEHLGLEPGKPVQLPYITELHLSQRR